MGVNVVLFLLFTSIPIATSVIITATPGNVSVRKGEQLQLLCDIRYEDDDSISVVRWYQMPQSNIYGEAYVSRRCGQTDAPCPVVNTSDSRGTMRYVNGDYNNATLTLTIDESAPEDNRDFICGIVAQKGANPMDHYDDTISVVVNYLPNATYPRCSVTPYQLETSAVPPILTCSSEKACPVVSLEWTTSVHSSRISLSNSTVIVGSNIENNLNLGILGTSYNYLTFTCYMTSKAYPGIDRSCSISLANLRPQVTEEPRSPQDTKVSSTVSSTLSPLVQNTRLSPTDLTGSTLPDTSNYSPTEKFTPSRDESRLSPSAQTTPLLSTKTAQSTLQDISQPRNPTESFTPSRDVVSANPSYQTRPSSNTSDHTRFASGTILIAVSAAAGGVIIILVCVIACLVSSRTTLRRREKRNMSFNMSMTAEISSQVSYNYVHDNHSHNSEIGGYNIIPMGDIGPTSPTPSASPYAVVPVAGLQQPPVPTYAVLNPDTLQQQNTNDYSYSIMQSTGKHVRKDDTASDEEANKRQHDQEHRHLGDQRSAGGAAKV